VYESPERAECLKRAVFMGQIDWRTTTQEIYQGDLLYFFREEMRGIVSFALAGCMWVPLQTVVTLSLAPSQFFQP
jgi:hypothetical protein